MRRRRDPGSALSSPLGSRAYINGTVGEGLQAIRNHEAALIRRAAEQARRRQLVRVMDELRLRSKTQKFP